MPPSADSYHPRVSLHDGHVLGQLVDKRGNGASLCPRFQCLSQHQLGLLGHENDGRTLFIERQGRIGVPPRIGSLTEPGCIDMLACASGIGNRRVPLDERRAHPVHGSTPPFVIVLYCCAAMSNATYFLRFTASARAVAS